MRNTSNKAHGDKVPRPYASIVKERKINVKSRETEYRQADIGCKKLGKCEVLHQLYRLGKEVKKRATKHT